MRKLLLILPMLLCAQLTFAQSVIVVDSEQVFKSLAEYNSAITLLEKMTQVSQAEVDAKFDEVEKLFNEYTAQRATLSSAKSREIEAMILAKESEATKFQEETFSKDGTLMQERLELIAPIQKRVFSAIEAYAAKVGADIVLDKASNPSLLFNTSASDHTQGVIEALK